MDRRRGGHALVVVAIDGLVTTECGVGTVVSWFFECIDEVAAAVPVLRNHSWSLYAISPRVSSWSEDYSLSQHRFIAAACAARGGEFLWLDNPNSEDLSAVWSHDDPGRMCTLLAGQVARLCRRHEKVTVLVHGVMLANVRGHLPAAGNLQVVYITHSLGRAFTDETAGPRVAMDARAFAAMAPNRLDRIGYIGAYFHDLLRDRYGLPEATLAPFVNAVPRRRIAELPDDNAAEELLRPWGVPKGRRLAFSWGRCHPQKGFDILLPAFGAFRERPGNDDWHLVALMPQGLTDPAYRETIDGLLACTTPGSVTAVTNFDQQLPLHVLRSPALELVVFASRFEGAPLSVLETLSFARPGVRVVWNDTPSLAQFLAGRTGAVACSELTVSGMTEALVVAAASTSGLGSQPVASYEDNTAVGLHDVLAWWG